MGEYAQVVMYELRGPVSIELDNFLDVDNDYPMNIYQDELDDITIQIVLDDDMVKIYKINGESAIVVQLLELGKLGIRGYIITLDNWSELAKYEITENGVNESWINLDNIGWEFTRNYPSNSSEIVI